MVKEVKKKMGRPCKDNICVSVSLMNEFHRFIKRIGHESVSFGMNKIWEEVKKDKDMMKRLKKR